MNTDAELVKEPMAVDLIMRIVADEGRTKTEILRAYPDMVTRTIHYRLCEMFDLGWIEYRVTADTSRRIFATDKGQFINDVVDTMLIEVEDLS